ncbi:YhcN/YlaJ family sporulation lipoprotein [Paenactinomyces guangxiensis]|uniref:YhcN/YlaJ family sporulation lipoprotein n=1 Tax=Paenactinomyces guangxiensis TaxID=1490290 RepID=A0A7W1WQP4_9BACL|nr:YhcN/YlaJ family sporulation lipoprotein [Paenactinomyces guangxiensis]MBA4494280.1 YhcN/YlaJ family sporulation lipoprotein [Paenactinomyces guangxiensis]MBH8590774.1 YhcN/YlaJ family sporulation lipoprotein [Paenactinomyces guangxiensis]
MKPLLKWFGVINIFLLALCGCQPENKPPANESAPRAGQQISYTQRVRQTAPNQPVDRSPQAVAQRMVNLAVSVPQVRNATAISLGRYTIVGIDVDPALDRGRVGTIKYTVAQALQEDPQGSRALVTADVDLVQRIRELNDDLRNGRPVGGIMDELAEIAARISPQPSKEVKQREEAPNKINQERMNQSPNAPARQ